MKPVINKGYSLVLAVDQKWGIGKENQMPWPKFKRDLNNFVRVTTDSHTEEQTKLPVFFQTEDSLVPPSDAAAPTLRNAVVMGRNTWLSLPKKWRPLRDRLNVILTTDKAKLEEILTPQEKEDESVKIYDDMKTMFSELEADESVREIIVIGGAAVVKL